MQAQPRDEDVDMFGITHEGKKRPENQDHFLIGSIHRRMKLHDTSLPRGLEDRLTGQAASMMLLVADGVGGGKGGAEASRMAIEAMVQYLVHKADVCNTMSGEDPEAFFAEIEKALSGAHLAITRRAGQDPALEGMATTLTAVAAIWPMAYITQVGDSRCYLLRDDELQRLTKDQTLGQQLVDSGAMTESGVRNSPWDHVLYSSIGGSESHPDLQARMLKWDDVLLLCSDGLTKHVSEDELAVVLREEETAEHACRRLLQMALDGGGTDNVTVVVARLKPGTQERALQRSERTERLYPDVR